MLDSANVFLASYNRIDKWMREQLDSNLTMGFSELVRRLARKKDNPIHLYEDDLLQMGQLRNAIVHEKISEDFIIAEPNQWAVSRIQEIEEAILAPEKVCPKFEKKVTGFEVDVPLHAIFSMINQHGYSQFPIYQKGNFKGLITAHGLGIWVAHESHESIIDVREKSIRDILAVERRKNNFKFISKETNVFQVKELFMGDPFLEAILITKDGNPNGNLLGIIRPRDVFQVEE